MDPARLGKAGGRWREHVTKVEEVRKNFKQTLIVVKWFTTERMSVVLNFRLRWGVTFFAAVCLGSALFFLSRWGSCWRLVVCELLFFQALTTVRRDRYGWRWERDGVKFLFSIVVCSTDLEAWINYVWNGEYIDTSGRVLEESYMVSANKLTV